jgi:glycosyltransferase involved in cell wall biosynthesis
MNALVTASARFVLTPDGALWTHNPAIRYEFWTRYLDVYENVSVLARAREETTPPDGWWKLTGDGVGAAPVTDFHSPTDYLKIGKSIKRSIRRSLAEPAALHLRLPCPVGGMVWKMKDSNRPYGVEVVGDPADVFARGAFSHPARSLYRALFARALRRQCADANTAAYVTEKTLQVRYPPTKASFATHFSSISLADDAIVAAPREYVSPPDPARLVTVGTLEQLYKAPDVLIKAVERVIRSGVDVHLTLVGDGAQRPYLEQLVRDMGLSEQIRFAGQLDPASVRAELDGADVFVLPSLQEGLPKAMIEAMARALPCIGSTAGGTPELLDSPQLVEPGSVEQLADCIRSLVTDVGRLNSLSELNLERAKAYREDVLRKRRIAFYEHTSDLTSRWLNGDAPAIVASEEN